MDQISNKKYLDMQRDMIHGQKKSMEMDKRYKEKDPHIKLVYESQEIAATKIVEHFIIGDKNVVLLLAPMMSGKTGTMLEVAYQMCTHSDDDVILDPKNVHLITGMSDADWLKDMKESAIPAYRDNVEHRPNLRKLVTATDCLIMIDECHYAATKKQTIHNVLHELGFQSIDDLRNRRIRILLISATPNHTGHDVTTIEEKYRATVKLDVPSEYLWFEQIIQENRFLEAKKLHVQENADGLIHENLNIWNSPKYHIIRIPKGSYARQVVSNIQKSCDKFGWDFSRHDSEDRIENINDMLKIKPERHHVIVIKDFWRASKRFPDQHIGFVHENSARKADDSVTAQGLLGRMLGYNKQRGPNAPRLYGNMSSIKQYMDWFKTGGDFYKANFYSSTCKSKGGHVRHKKSFVTSYSEEIEQPSVLKQNQDHAVAWALKNLNIEPSSMTGREKDIWLNNTRNKVCEWLEGKNLICIKNKGQVYKIPIITNEPIFSFDIRSKDGRDIDFSIMNRTEINVNMRERLSITVRDRLRRMVDGETSYSQLIANVEQS